MIERNMYIDISKHADSDVVLPGIRGLKPVAHRFEKETLHALNAALAAGRPLLVRGEPGTGKSQLARAAAMLLGRGFIWRVVDAETRAKDLFYEFDAVARLAEAQVAGKLPSAELAEVLDERRFVIPGPLWWAFAPKRAREWLKKDRRGEDSEGLLTEEEAGQGVVLLLDEIDKCDPSVPNGLLEALGQGTFPVPKAPEVSLHAKGTKPLVIFTTNEERELPSAFLRRCFVLHIVVPEGGPNSSKSSSLAGRPTLSTSERSMLGSPASTMRARNSRWSSSGKPQSRSSRTASQPTTRASRDQDRRSIWTFSARSHSSSARTPSARRCSTRFETSPSRNTRRSTPSM